VKGAGYVPAASQRTEIKGEKTAWATEVETSIKYFPYTEESLDGF
jgi:hypothetical protein